MEPALAIFLENTYGLSLPKITQTVERGQSAFSNHIIETTSGKYFLKTYNPKRPREQIEEIQRAELFFNSHDIPAVAPLPNRSGETLSLWEGKYLALFPYIADRELDSLPSETTTSSIAATSAHLHLATKDDHSLIVERVQDRWHKDNFLRDAQQILDRISAISYPSPFDMQARELLELRMKAATSATLRFEELDLPNDTVLHGDYHYHNMFFNDLDQVSHLFDFERVRRGPRTTELAYGIFFNCFDINNPALDELSDVHFSRAQIYIKAYRAEYPIENEEIKKGILWFYYAHQVCQLYPLSWHYIDNNFRSDKLVPKRLSRFKYFRDNLDALLALAVAK